MTIININQIEMNVVALLGNRHGMHSYIDTLSKDEIESVDFNIIINDKAIQSMCAEKGFFTLELMTEANTSRVHSLVHARVNEQESFTFYSLLDKGYQPIDLIQLRESCYNISLEAFDIMTDKGNLIDVPLSIIKACSKSIRGAFAEKGCHYDYFLNHESSPEVVGRCIQGIINELWLPEHTGDTSAKQSAWELLGKCAVDQIALLSKKTRGILISHNQCVSQIIRSNPSSSDCMFLSQSDKAMVSQYLSKLSVRSLQSSTVYLKILTAKYGFHLGVLAMDTHDTVATEALSHPLFNIDDVPFPEFINESALVNLNTSYHMAQVM